jgi:hypothetical protein
MASGMSFVYGLTDRACQLEKRADLILFEKEGQLKIRKLISR